MRVGLNAVFMTKAAGGIGTYTSELIASLLRLGEDIELTVVTSPEAPPEFRAGGWADDVQWVDVPKGPASAWNTVEVLAQLPAIALRRKFDLLHSPAGIGPLKIPRVPRVVTLHDLIWFHEAERVALPARARFITKTLAFQSARDAVRVITPSEDSARDVAATVGVARERIDVIPHGIDSAVAAEPTPEAELRKRLSLGAGRIVLAVAQRRPYKNLDSLIRALPDLPDDVSLVLAGTHGPAEPELRALAQSLDVTERVVFPDWLAAEDLEGLYAVATCVALPSFMEGFGLPVLEAMRRGVPVVCSETSALGEVAGDAALLVDPRKQRAITAALERVLADDALRSDLAQRGRLRAAQFTWERAARAHIDVYRRATGASAAGSLGTAP